ncbi:MAG: DNA cytosine methyltransferase [Candidatus Micrarchaeia archaeon]
MVGEADMVTLVEFMEKSNQSKKRTAISLFTGAGGMDIGITKADFDVLACIEKDHYCCETLRFNIKREGRKTTVIEKDITTVDPNALMKELRLEKGRLDLLFGGPPCQAFSMIGKKEGLEDERGLLLFQMVRFAKVLKPKAILIENVKGLVGAKDKKGKVGGILLKLLSQLDALGYVPKWKIINSADLGVPQKRERVFIVATQKPNGFEFPAAKYNDPGSPTLLPLKSYVTAGEALAGLPCPSKKNDTNADSFPNHIDVTPQGDRNRINGVSEGKPLAKEMHLPISQRKGLTRKDTTKFLRLSRSRPSNTLRCGEIFFHPTDNRLLTPREYMRLHGFPDEYVLMGPVRSRSGRVRDLDQHRQVANSVPPIVAEEIGIEIRRVFDAQNI